MVTVTTFRGGLVLLAACGMNSATHAQVNLDDGSLFVPAEYLDAIREEYNARGTLTVARAQVLIEKWNIANKS